MKMQLYIAACIVLFVVPPVFVWNRVYNDGVVGRAALLFVSFASATVLLNLYDQRDIVPSWQTVVLMVSFAAFLVWHLVRFHTRVTRARAKEFDRAQHDTAQSILRLK